MEAWGAVRPRDLELFRHPSIEMVRLCGLVGATAGVVGVSAVEMIDLVVVGRADVGDHDGDPVHDRVCSIAGRAGVSGRDLRE